MRDLGDQARSLVQPRGELANLVAGGFVQRDIQRVIHAVRLLQGCDHAPDGRKNAQADQADQQNHGDDDQAHGDDHGLRHDVVGPGNFFAGVFDDDQAPTGLAHGAESGKAVFAEGGFGRQGDA